MKEIKLNAGLGRYDNVSPFVIGDLELYISNLPMVSGDFRFLAWSNGKLIGKYTLSHTDPRVIIPHDKLAAGTFSCRVDHYNGDTLVRHYRVEDLVIKEVDSDLTAVPEIADMQSRIKALEGKTACLDKETESLKKALGEEVSARKKLEEVVAAYRADIIALIKWAYGVQNEVPYLDGFNVDKFIKSAGFTLSDEEKSAIGDEEDEL